MIRQSSYEIENFEEIVQFLTECVSQADIRLRELNSDLFVQTLMELCTACGNLPAGPLSVLRQNQNLQLELLKLLSNTYPEQRDLGLRILLVLKYAT